MMQACVPMGRRLRISIVRGWRGMGRRRRVGLGLLAALLLVGGGWAYRWWNDWPVRALLPGPGFTWVLAFAPDGKSIATTKREAEGIILWDAADGRRRAEWEVPGRRNVCAGAFAADGRTFAAVSYLRGQAQPLMLHLIDVASGRTRSTIPATQGGIFGLAVLGDGRTVRLIAVGPGAVEVVDADADSGRLISSRPLSCPPPTNHPVANSDDGRWLALVPSNTNPKLPSNEVIFWDVDGDREAGRLPGRPGAAEISGLGFSRDGSTLGVGREDETIELWDLGTHRLLKTLRGHRAGYVPWILKFAPDGSTLASNARYSARPALTLETMQWHLARLRGDRNWIPPVELILIDTASGRTLHRLSEEARATYSFDGRSFATSHLEGPARVRDLPGKCP
jgi:WD40 repeat protein